MPRRIATLVTLALFAAVALWSRDALAGDLTVTLAEHEDRTVIEVRSPDGEVPEPKQVVANRGSMLLFFPEAKVGANRLHTDEGRLRYVQLGHSRGRAAVRLIQRKKFSGSLRKFVEQIPVEGGLDVVVRNEPPEQPPSAEPEPSPAQAPTDAEAVDRASTLAALAAAPHAAPAPEDPPTAPLPATAVDAKAAPPPADPVAAGFLDDPTAEDGQSEGDQGPVATGSLTTAVMIVSIFGIGVGLWWLRRRNPGAGPQHAMTVVSRVGIGPRQQVLWLKAGDRELLVGATEQRIQLLAELGAPAATAVTAAADPKVQPPAAEKIAAFKQRLRSALGEEARGETDEDNTVVPLLDPRWTQTQEVA